ncbi:MAG: hypothetical protein U5M50_06735, partial [Sphingobium sp.]|nr:hypothetical protein [Sphingobium sp.]
RYAASTAPDSAARNPPARPGGAPAEHAADHADRRCRVSGGPPSCAGLQFGERRAVIVMELADVDTGQNDRAGGRFILPRVRNDPVQPAE